MQLPIPILMFGVVWITNGLNGGSNQYKVVEIFSSRNWFPWILCLDSDEFSFHYYSCAALVLHFVWFVCVYACVFSVCLYLWDWCFSSFLLKFFPKFDLSFIWLTIFFFWLIQFGFFIFVIIIIFQLSIENYFSIICFISVPVLNLKISFTQLTGTLVWRRKMDNEIHSMNKQKYCNCRYRFQP